jgi:cytochrome c-type biogenesis protein
MTSYSSKLQQFFVFVLLSLSGHTTQVQSLRYKSAFYGSKVATQYSARVSPLKFSGDIGVDLYDAQLTVSQFVESQLATASPTSIAFLYGAGLLTAFSPCSISLLPLTVAYLGGSESTKSSDGTKEVNNAALSRSILYASGLASTLTLFGLSAAMLGNVFGSSGAIGDASALLSSVVFLVMGLYLLGLVNIEFPSFQGKVGTTASDEKSGFFSSGSVQAFLFGATSALVASPCSSPVLTSLLAFVASSGDATIGTNTDDFTGTCLFSVSCLFYLNFRCVMHDAMHTYRDTHQ